MPEPITESGKLYTGIFDPNTGTFGKDFQDLYGNLKNFSTALPMSDQENRGTDIATGTDPNFQGTMKTLADLHSMSMEGARTGFRQDIAPLIPQAQQRYRDFADQSRNSFADSNILSGSDFQRNLLREDARINTDLTSQQFGENVRAAQARGDWSNMAQNLGVLQTSYPMAYAADLYGMGEKRRLSQEQIRGRPYQMFQSLSGAENQVPFFQQGYNPNSSSAANLNALTQALSTFNPGSFGTWSGGGGGGRGGIGGVNGSGGIWNG